MKAVKVIIIILLALILIGGGVGYSYLNSIKGPLTSGSEELVTIEIPSGSSTEDIGNILVENKIIKSTFGFKVFSRLNEYDGKYIAGNYVVSPGMTTEEICETICNGRITAMIFTIPEGYTLSDITDILVANGYVNRDTFEAYLENGNFTDYDFLKYAQPGKNRLEGFLFPSTYSLPPNSTEEDIIRAMLDKFGEEFTADMKKQGEDLGYNLNEILTIASIIEKETPVDSDRPLVSSVIYNRLDIGMYLGMDSTVLYSLGEHKQNLTYDDTSVDSPYNTYINFGLPPGPICCPGKASLEAALNPAETDYIYFVVSPNGDGTSNFSDNYEQFEKDKEAYYASLEDSSENTEDDTTEESEETKDDASEEDEEDDN